jgi:hypothetical protein
LSRRQLVVRSDGEAATFERVGRCAMRVNGDERKEADVGTGDVIYLRKELLLYCVRRPAVFPASRHFPESAVRAFGEPDAAGILGESPSAWTLRERVGFAASWDAYADHR